MQEQRIQKHILERLSRGDHADDITYEVCEATGLHWQAAEQLVQQTQSEKEHVITRRQSPLLFLLAAGLFTVGAVLVVSTVGQIWSAADILTKPGDPGMEETALLISLLVSAPEAIGGVIFGIGLMGGSIIGMTRVWTSILTKD